MMAIFRYLSEADTDEEFLTNQKIKDMIGLDSQGLIKLFIEYMRKYPELLEFPNGIQNLMTLENHDFVYDFELLKNLTEVFAQNFHIIMTKD